MRRDISESLFDLGPLPVLTGEKKRLADEAAAKIVAEVFGKAEKDKAGEKKDEKENEGR